MFSSFCKLFCTDYECTQQLLTTDPANSVEFEEWCVRGFNDIRECIKYNESDTSEDAE